MSEKPFAIGADFESRNWLLLNRLSDMGISPEEARSVVKEMEKTGKPYREILKNRKLV